MKPYLPADFGDVIVFESLLRRLAEHIVLVYGREPVGDGRGEVVAASESVALDERPRAEVA